MINYSTWDTGIFKSCNETGIRVITLSVASNRIFTAADETTESGKCVK